MRLQEREGSTPDVSWWGPTKIGHQPGGGPAAVYVSSNFTPILTDERPPLGADGPLGRIEPPCGMSINRRRETITSGDKSMPRKSECDSPVATVKPSRLR